jgi:hypothetical protein
MPVVGILYSAPIDVSRDELSAFRKGLAEVGYVDGRNVAFELRTAENHLNRLPPIGRRFGSPSRCGDFFGEYGSAGPRCKGCHDVNPHSVLHGR